MGPIGPGIPRRSLINVPEKTGCACVRVSRHLAEGITSPMGIWAYGHTGEWSSSVLGVLVTGRGLAMHQEPMAGMRYHVPN